MLTTAVLLMGVAAVTATAVWLISPSTAGQHRTRPGDPVQRQARDLIAEVEEQLRWEAVRRQLAAEPDPTPFDPTANATAAMLYAHDRYGVAPDWHAYWRNGDARLLFEGGPALTAELTETRP